jgi:hypothetical protein
VEVNNNDMINHETVKLKPSTSQIEVGRIIRKPTYPQNILAPKRAHVPEGDEDEDTFMTVSSLSLACL